MATKIDFSQLSKVWKIAAGGGVTLLAVGGVVTTLLTKNQAGIATRTEYSDGRSTQSGEMLVKSGSLAVRLRANGDAVVQGTLSGNHLYAGTMSGAGLSDCDADGQALSWDATLQRFICGDDDTGASSPEVGTVAFSGGIIRLSDPRYVNTAGDTMTGALTINVTGGSRNTVGLNVLNAISGAVIQASKTLASSGSLVVEDNAQFGSGAVFIISSTKRLGIGRSPTQKFDVYNEGGSPVLNFESIQSSGRPAFQFKRASGDDETTKAALVSGGVAGEISAWGWDGTSAYRNGAMIFFQTAATTSPTSSPMNITFQTTPTGTVTPVERFRISATGNMGMGIGSINSNNKLTVSGSVFIGRDATTQTTDAGVGLEVLQRLSGATLNVSKTAVFAGSGVVISNSGSTVFNELSRDVDFRIEGDTLDALFFLDASTDRVGIGTRTPKALLDVNGAISGVSLFVQGVRISTGSTLPVKVSATTTVVANTITETTLGKTFTIPANSVKSGDTFMITASGTGTHKAATFQPIRFHVKLGNTAVVQSGSGSDPYSIAFTEAPEVIPWTLTSYLTFASVGTNAVVRADLAYVDNCGSNCTYANVGTGAIVNTTSDLVLKLSAQWVNADIDNTMSTLRFHIVKLTP